VVKLDSKGQLVVRDTCGRFHDHGYDLALSAVRSGADKHPGTLPIVSMIGSTLGILDTEKTSFAHGVAE